MSKITLTFHPTNLTCLMGIPTCFSMKLALFFFFRDYNSHEILVQCSLFLSEKYLKERHS